MRRCDLGYLITNGDRVHTKHNSVIRHFFFKTVVVGRGRLK